MTRRKPVRRRGRDSARNSRIISPTHRVHELHRRETIVADLTKGVIVILSGGGFDEMNPQEVRDRMDECITRVNNDPFVQAHSGGAGLTFHLLAGQTTKHLHQTKWRALCDALKLLAATPLIIVGHSNGGAAPVSLSRGLKAGDKTLDLVFSAGFGRGARRLWGLK